MRLLSVRDLRIVNKAGQSLVRDLSFDLATGERMAIVGESGSGKTLATRALLGLLAPGLAVEQGSITFEGRDLAAATCNELRAIRGAGIGMVFQEPMTSLNPAMKIGKQLAEGVKLHRGLGAAEIHRLSLEMLQRIGIEDPEGALRAFPHQFSGGMRQRIMLASVLLLKPRLLIADEPTTALDTLRQREVMELMVELTREVGTALLLITHDLGLVARYTDRVLVMEKGVQVEEGVAENVLRRPVHPYTAKLIGSFPKRTELRQPLSTTAPAILTIDHLTVEYPGRRGLVRAGAPKRVLSGVDLNVRIGEIVALVGGSGSGKTTLGRAAVGLKESSDGSIKFNGADLSSLSRAQRRLFRQHVQLVFQDPFSSLDPRLRVADIVGATLRHLPGLSKARRGELVARTLDDVGLNDFAQRYPHEMSGGQRQRVAIARAIVAQPRLVVADEPVSALDLTVQRQVLALFQKLQRDRGFACLFITHDLAVVEQVADRIVVLEDGIVVEEGETDEVFAKPRHPYTRALLAATPLLH